MKNSSTAVESAFFAGLARPPMFLGVTINFLYISGMFSLCFFIGTQSLLSVLIVYPSLHLIGMIGCHNDKDFFTILLTMAHCRYMPNARVWRMKSYEPF